MYGRYHWTICDRYDWAIYGRYHWAMYGRYRNVVVTSANVGEIFACAVKHSNNLGNCKTIIIIA